MAPNTAAQCGMAKHTHLSDDEALPNFPLVSQMAAVKMDIPHDMAAKSADFDSDEGSTDVGSGTSDTETSCSSAVERECGPLPFLGGQAEVAVGISGSGMATNIRGSRHRIGIPSKYGLAKVGRFGGTPLEPIPGSPVKAGRGRDWHAEFPGADSPEADCAPEEKDATIKVEEFDQEVCEARAPPGLSLPRSAGVCGDVQSSAPLSFQAFGQTAVSSPKRRARAVMLAKAKQEAAPLRVQLPEDFEGPIKQLDPALPAKKRPTFTEFSSITGSRLKPGMPAKKRVSRFLIEASPRVVTPLPR